ncbi:MAG: carotenoid 1,2-hydratase [Sandarakinorhabdus sp.]|nr:carotenoid 1,2-hydratase [Sandarakinorhabdus sp.]
MRLFSSLPAAALAAAALLLTAAAPTFTSVIPNTPIALPRDHGAHPNFRTEWWYVTGWLTTPEHQKLGFQITFFRTRLATDPANPSKFAPKQILFAHAALSDPAAARLRHAQRIARQGFGLAEVSTADTKITLDDWSLQRRADGQFTAHVAGDGFALDLTLTPTQAAILQGDAGYSQKGPDPAEASHYFSLPHLKVGGSVTRAGKPAAITGTAWLDREWSSTLLNPRAVGWDWLGLNMDDGGALTLFRVRDAAGAPVWAGGSYRDKTGHQTKFAPTDVRFTAARRWKSPRTGALYPVAPTVTVRLNGIDRTIPVTPLFPDQELDSRRGGGPVYWEGAVTVPGGRGYLEMTGYAAPLKM